MITARAVLAPITRLILLAAMALTAGACGTTPPPEPTPSTPSSVGSDQTRVLQTYFDGLAVASTPGFRRAFRVVQPGSPAAVFAEHQHNMLSGSRSPNDAGTWITSVSVGSDSVNWRTVGPLQVTDAAEFVDFKFDSADRIVSWRLDGGPLLEDSVAAIADSLSSDGVHISVETAYRTAGGDLQVAFKVSGQPGSVEAKAYVYRGSALAGERQPYAMEVRPNAVTPGWAVVPGAGWGGRQTFEVNYGDKNLSVPIRR